MKVRITTSVIVLCALAALWLPPRYVTLGQEIEATSKPFEGVEVNILTYLEILEPLRSHAGDFGTISGATINIVGVPYGDLYQNILTDLRGTNQYDAYVFLPQWLVDYVETGNIEDLTARVMADPDLQWEDVAPFYRNYHTTYGGRIYTIPLDGDFMMLYYRKDLLEQVQVRPPATWQEYLQVAARFHGQDLNEDGEPDFGSCIPKYRFILFWFFFTFATPYLQSLGTSQGVFFNIRTMEPLANNPAFAAALEVFRDTGDYGPPDQLNLNAGAIRDLFVSGRCALAVDWGDLGMWAIGSYVADRTGVAILPGSEQVFDRDKGQMVWCKDNPAMCPYAINGINHAPFAAVGGWSAALNATSDPRVKDAAYAFFSYVSQPEQSAWDVTQYTTGFNPYRISHFENIEPWLDAGMSRDLANSYLGAIEQSLGNANMALDLRLPGTHEYQEAVNQAVRDFLEGSTGQALDRALHGSADDTTTCMQQIYQSWQQITDKYGRSLQQERYRKSLSWRELYLPVIRKQR
jgi:multiple sugar transport system substrate-binding protein